MTDGLPPPFGDYVPVRAVARGAQGAVYEVRSLTTGAVLAAKVIRAGDERARARFRREGELLARCDRHPGIVKVHATGESPDGQPWLVMDLVAGESLAALLAREGRLAPARAGVLARKIAVALGHVHALGVVHRDVKPENVLIDERGEPLLTDFGLALADDVERLTRTGAFVGTPSYLAPEQARSSHHVGPATDVYSLGCVLFEMLAGVPPIEASTFHELLQKLVVSRRSLRDVRELAPDVPAPLAALVARLLERDPARRPSDGAALARALDAALGPGATVRPSPLRPGRVHAALLALVLVASGLLASGLLLAARQRPLGGEREAARVALVLAREALDRVRGAPGRPATPDAWRAGLAAANEAARHGAEAARLAGFREPDQDEAASLVRDLSLVGAARELAAGGASAALELLDAVPRETLSPGARLLRGRALLALGRREEAAAEATTAARVPDIRADALELEGDACVGSGADPRRAVTAYGDSLGAGTRRPLELRAKRAGALAAAGDEAGALSELATLGKLGSPIAPEIRAALAPVAPALYARAVAADRELEAAERDLDLALRLAPPPAARAREWADAWLESCLGKRGAASFDRAFSAGYVGDEEGQQMFELCVRRFEKAARARELDPAVTLGPFRHLARTIFTHALGRGRATQNGAYGAHSDRLAAAWPDEPFFLGCAVLGRRPGWEEQSVRIVTLLPEAREAPELEGVNGALLRQVLASWQKPTAFSAGLEPGLVTRVAMRAGNAPGWLAAREWCHATGHHELERGALEAARAADRDGADDLMAMDAEIVILWDEGRNDEALALARRYHERSTTATDPVPLIAYLEALRRCRLPGEVLKLVPSMEGEPGLLRQRALALVALDRAEEAWAIVQQLEERGGDSLAATHLREEIERELSRIRASGR